MASLIVDKVPLHRPPLSSGVVTLEKASPLLRRKITLYFGGADHKDNKVVTTVAEIYQRCQMSLSEKFGPNRLIIRGSSVSHLFSGEPFGDIDIHATTDVVDLPAHERIGRGYAIKWALLKGISQIISEQLPSDPSGNKVLIPSTEILYKEETNLLCSKGAPFNVHTIRLPGDCPLEFTVFHIVKKIEESVRNYDFNSGSLHLSIEEGGDIRIHSSTRDIGITIEELERRELTCHSPEEIERKALCRYLAKLVISGYYDKDKELLPTIIESIQKCNAGKEAKALAKGVIKEIRDHFEGKGIDPLAGMLFLWLQPNLIPDPGSPRDLTFLLTEVKEELKESFFRGERSEHKAFFTLVQRGKKAECCWYLLMQSKSARRVLHRGEDSLQLEICAYPMFAKEELSQSVFLIIPILGLTKLTESVIPQRFFDLYQVDHPQIQVEGGETKALLQSICHDVLIKAPLFPILSSVINRFGIENQGDFSKLFSQWIKLNDQLAEQEKQKIPLPVLRKLEAPLFKALEDPSLFKQLEEVLEGRSMTSLPVFSMLKMLHQLIGIKGLCSVESIRSRRIITGFTWGFFSHREKLGLLSPEDERIMLDLGRTHVEDLCKLETLISYQRKAENLLSSRTLSLLQLLYVRDQASLSEGILCVKLYLGLGYPAEGMKVLQIIIKKQPSLDSDEIQSLFQELVKSHPSEYVSVLIENSHDVKLKTGVYSSIILPFLEELTARAPSPKLIANFIEVVDALCQAGEKEQIIKTLFIKAATRDPHSKILFEEVGKFYKLSATSFGWISEMVEEELNFLREQEGFASLFETAPDFTMQVLERAVLVGNLSIASLGSFHLAKTDPDRCLRSIYLLNSLRKTSRDFRTLEPSLKALVRLLQLHQTFRVNESLKPLITAGLEVLEMYLAPSGDGSFAHTEMPLFTNLQDFHRLVALSTLESPAWPLLWKRIERLESAGINEWINLADLGQTIAEINMKGNILKLIDSFELDGPFVYEFARQAMSLPGDSLSKFVVPIIHVINKDNLNFLATAPSESPADAPEVLSFVWTAFRRIPYKDPVKRFNSNLKFCSFWAAYAGKDKEIAILESLNVFFEEKNAQLLMRCKKRGEIGKILFLFAKRAIERKDIVRLCEIKDYYMKWRGHSAFSRRFYSKDMEIRCAEWEEILEEIFKDKDKNRTLMHGAQEFDVIEFYSMFLADAVMAYPEETRSTMTASEVAIKEVTDQSILELIRFLTRKKLLKATVYIESINVLEPIKFGKDSLNLLASRFMHMANEVLGEMEKHPINQEDLKAFNDLLGDLFTWIHRSEQGFTIPKVVHRDVIVKILEKARSILPYFTAGVKPLLRTYHTIGYIETCLNKQEMMDYYMSWARSILARKETPEIGGELSQWFVLTLKLDPKRSSKISEGIYSKYLEGKLFIQQDYFMNLAVIRIFIEMIDLGFKKKYEFSKIEIQIVDYLEFDVFTLVQKYYSYLREGINNIEKSSPAEAIKLRRSFIGNLVAYLEKPKSNCKACTIAALWGFIFHRLGTKVCLAAPQGFEFPDLVNMMYLIIQNIPLTDNNEIDMPTVVLSLRNAYEETREGIHRLLTPAQIEEFEHVIYRLYKEDGGIGSSGSALKIPPPIITIIT